MNRAPADVRCPCGCMMSVIGCCIQTDQPIRWCADCGAIKTCDQDPIQPAGGLPRAMRIINGAIAEATGKAWFHPELDLAGLLARIIIKEPNK